jgi:hypothetical protein
VDQCGCIAQRTACGQWWDGTNGHQFLSAMEPFVACAGQLSSLVQTARSNPHLSERAPFSAHLVYTSLGMRCHRVYASSLLQRMLPHSPSLEFIGPHLKGVGVREALSFTCLSTAVRPHPQMHPHRSGIAPSLFLFVDPILSLLTLPRPPSPSPQHPHYSHTPLQVRQRRSSSIGPNPARDSCQIPTDARGVATDLPKGQRA